MSSGNLRVHLAMIHLIRFSGIMHVHASVLKGRLQIYLHLNFYLKGKFAIFVTYLVRNTEHFWQPHIIEFIGTNANHFMALLFTLFKM